MSNHTVVLETTDLSIGAVERRIEQALSVRPDLNLIQIESFSTSHHTYIEGKGTIPTTGLVLLFQPKEMK